MQLKPWSLVLWHVTECGCPWYWKLGDRSKVPICCPTFPLDAPLGLLGLGTIDWFGMRWGKKNRWGIRWKLLGDEYCVCKACKICLPTYTLLGAANSIETLWVLRHHIYEVLGTVEVFLHQLFLSNVSLSHVICFHVLYLKFLPARFLSSDLTTSQWIHLNFWCPSRWLTLSFATNDPHWNQQFSPKNGWLGGPILPSACWKVAPVA